MTATLQQKKDRRLAQQREATARYRAKNPRPAKPQTVDCACVDCGAPLVRAAKAAMRAKCDECRAAVRTRRSAARWQRERGSRKPRTNAPWVNQAGYVERYVPYSPYSRANGVVLEHRLVMSEHLGRALLPSETVHHRSGVRTDNRLENLQLMSSSHPSGQAVEDKAEWALELLALYAPDKLSTAPV